MYARIIRAEYEDLGRLARMFGERMAACGQMLASLRTQMAILESGGWIGPGATAFYREMNGEVFPSLARLIAALEQAGAATLRIGAIIHQAEGDASKILAMFAYTPSPGGPIPIPYPNLGGAGGAIDQVAGSAVGQAERLLDDLIMRSASSLQGQYDNEMGSMAAVMLEYQRLMGKEASDDKRMAQLLSHLGGLTSADLQAVAQAISTGGAGAMTLAIFVASAVAQNTVAMPVVSGAAGAGALVGPALAALGSGSVGAIGQAASEALAALTRGDIGAAATYEEKVLLALMDLGRNAGQDFANAQDAFSRWSAENGQLTQARDAINGGLRVVKGMIDSVAAPEIRSALMSDFGDLEAQATRMQLAQASMTKTFDAISNMMKSMHDAQMAVIQNLR